MKLSGCIIAKDEEKNISNCIQSLKKVCDEVILVDTGSEDKTVLISQSLGAKTFFFKWIDDFSAAKNYAIEKAKGEWIIFLDADEYLENGDKYLFQQMIIEAEKRQFDSILCEIFNMSNKNESVIQHSHIGNRLFKNSTSIRFSGRIHEDLKKNNSALNSINGSKYFKIIHTGYIAEEVISKDKFNRNINLLFKELIEKPNSPELHYYIADTYGIQKNYEKQIEYAKKSIECGKISMIGFREEPYVLLIRTMLLTYKDLVSIKNEIDNAIFEFPDSPIFRYFLSVVYLRDYKYSLALENLDLALKLNETYTCFSTNNMRIHIKDIYSIKGCLYQLKKNYKESVVFFVKSLKEMPQQKNIVQYLIYILRNENDIDLISFLNKIYDINDESDLEFLISALSGMDNGTLLAYYEKKLFSLKGKGNNAVFLSLLKLGNYDSVFERCFESIKETNREDLLLLIFIAAILSEKDNYIQSILELVNSTMKKIINCIKYKSEEIFNDKDVLPYLEILNEIVSLKNAQKTKELVTISFKFENDISEKVAEIFYRNHKYDECIEYVFYVLEFKNVNSKTRLYKYLGINYYNIDEYSKAIEYFSKALEESNKDNEIYEYLLFIYEKVDYELKLVIEDKLKSIKQAEYIRKFIDKLQY